ncbi:hypothetical protein BDW72DRAFT_172048 [Aspergillus terricola var. indicus]
MVVRILAEPSCVSLVSLTSLTQPGGDDRGKVRYSEPNIHKYAFPQFAASPGFPFYPTETFRPSRSDLPNPLPNQLTYQVYIPPLYLLTLITASPTN